jgi:hypothetical protein
MTGLLETSQRAKARTKAKALGKKEKEKGAIASSPTSALTIHRVVIDRMTSSISFANF